MSEEETDETLHLLYLDTMWNKGIMDCQIPRTGDV